MKKAFSFDCLGIRYHAVASSLYSCCCPQCPNQRNLLPLRLKHQQEAAPAEASSGVVFSQLSSVQSKNRKSSERFSRKVAFNFTASDEGPLLDLLKAESETGKGTIDVIGALHGTYPPLERTDSLVNMIDIADDLGKDREFDKAFLKTGLLACYLYYVPWMQATYIMAANKGIALSARRR